MSVRQWVPIVAAAAVLLLGACGQSAPTGPVLHTVTGRVTVDDDVALSGVRVGLTGSSSAVSTRTAADGAYVFGGVGPGTYTVAIRDHPDHVAFIDTETSVRVPPVAADTLRVDFNADYLPVEITARSLPRAEFGSEYDHTLGVSGGDGQLYAWSIADGALPDGLILGESSGRISGRAIGYGTARFAVEVTSGDGQSARQEYELSTVLPPTARCDEHPDHALATFEDRALEARVVNAVHLIAGETDLACGVLREVSSIPHTEHAGIANLLGAQNLTGVLDLRFRANAITDLEPLRGLTDLQLLDLRENTITDVDALRELTGLELLDVRGNAITNVDPLSSLTGLGLLYLSENEVTDVTPLGELTSLRRLSLNGNPVTDVSPLADITSLRRLSLNRTSVADIEPLRPLSNLEALQIGGTQVQDLAALSDLTTLTAVILEETPSISDFSPLADLPDLFYLSITENPHLADLGFTAGLDALTRVILRANPKLQDIQPLISNVGLGPGDEVWLEGTPVPCSDVAELAAKGVSVLSDCWPRCLD